jgi:hypothetical protein
MMAHHIAQRRESPVVKEAALLMGEERIHFAGRLVRN